MKKLFLFLFLTGCSSVNTPETDSRIYKGIVASKEVELSVIITTDSLNGTLNGQPINCRYAINPSKLYNYFQGFISDTVQCWGNIWRDSITISIMPNEYTLHRIK